MEFVNQISNRGSCSARMVSADRLRLLIWSAWLAVLGSSTGVVPAQIVRAPPTPVPIPFQPQPVEVALGESGEKVTLMTTQDGGFTLDGEAFRSGGTVRSESGNVYTLLLAYGTWSARYDAPEVKVKLGSLKETVTLVKGEDGSYRLGEMVVESGVTMHTAANGHVYTLVMGDDGTWRAIWASGPSGQVVPAGSTAAGTVTLTNLTPGQVMAPAIVIIHGEDALPVFVPGKRASSALAMLAEDNQSSRLLSAAGRDPHVTYSHVLLGGGPNGMIQPGESAMLSITARPGLDQITVVASLTSTNDGFVGASGIPIPESGIVDQFLVAWDAGSEVNDEDCSHIPGPPCGNYVKGGRESVAIVTHSGIHGQGDLARERLDWDYPAARISVELDASR